MSSSFEWKNIYGYKAVVLKLENNEFKSEITVVPEIGANLLQFSYDGNIIIGYNGEALRRKDFTGTPILFPTPNRVFKANVIYNGKSYSQTKNGKKRICHGLVYDEPFSVCKIDCRDDSAYICLVLNIKEKTEFFNSFPFVSRLYITYGMDINGLTVKYAVENLSNDNFQFGFGIHPYFNFQPDDILFLPSNEFLELKNEYPTKRILPVDEFFGGIGRKGISIKQLSVDNDFIRKCNESVFINGSNYKIEIEASKQFRHFVVYKNKEDSFICVEPQTCSINAHNLQAEGFRHANLLNVASGETEEGYVKINVEVFGNDSQYRKCNYK